MAQKWGGSSIRGSLGTLVDANVLCAQEMGGGASPARGWVLTAKLEDRLNRGAGSNSCSGWVTR